MLRAFLLLCLGLAAAAESRAAAPSAGAVEVELTAELGHVSLRQVEILRLLISAARIMEGLYQRQAAPGGLYPADMSREEFEAWREPAARSAQTRIQRDPWGNLEAVPYHEAWPKELGRAARLLARAAEMTSDETLRSYLVLRARALITGDHARADAAWAAMRHSEVEILIGPIGVDADREFGLKAGFGACVLLRDWAWGARLARFTVFLPSVQHSLPVSGAFKSEVPDVDMKLAVYDLLYQAGHGARRLRLRNVMRARFDALVLPVADTLVVPAQRAEVGFEAHFLNTMLQEMAHNLGLRRTIDDRATVHEALGQHADTIEELKAAVLSLWMADWLRAQDELPETTRMAHYASFLASLFRGIQLDTWSPAGQARLILFNYFRDWGAFRREAGSGRYYVAETAMAQAIEVLAGQVLTIQGSGDRAAAAGLIDILAVARDEFRADLARLAAAGVPATVVFRQGEELLGL